VKSPEKILPQLVRVLKKGGVLHLIGEDYGMIQIYPFEANGEKWVQTMLDFYNKMGCDGRIGRKLMTLLQSEPLSKSLCSQRIDYITVDSCKFSRRPLEDLVTAWKNAYANVIPKFTNVNEKTLVSWYDDILRTIKSKDGYFVWHIPVVSAVKNV
jgi:ubiquinone/menaquinone biosynthesis C-methylase UbiE